MLLSLLLIFAISVGGLGVTYLIADDEPLLWRLAAGCAIGTAVFGTAGFAAAMLIGLNPLAVTIAFAISLAPLFVFLDVGRRGRFTHDWAAAKGKMQGANLTKFLRFAYYAFFLLLFIAFFGRAMIETDQGIFTGGSNNLGDLPFHLGAIFSFTDGANFPPANPNFAGAKFTYPFVADLATAMFIKIGAGGVRDIMLVQNTAWAFSLLIIFEGFVRRLTENRLAARLAPFLLFFSGGMGFIVFFGDYWAQAGGFLEFLGQLPKDYTINDEFRWGNAMVTLFLTQRSLLLGMPITLIILGGLWRIFAAVNNGGEKSADLIERFRAPVFSGLIAGLLPLVHLHSLAVLFVAGLFFLVLRKDRWRDWVLFAGGVAVMAVPELIWSLAGTATRAGDFFAWHLGWDARGGNLIWFWIKNTGLTIPLLAAGIYLVYKGARLGDDSATSGRGEKPAKKQKAGKHSTETRFARPAHKPSLLIMFYVPLVFIFVIANIAKLAPWEWDNIKVLIYWFAGSIPFIALGIAWLWERGAYYKIAAMVFFASMIFSGGLDVWRTASAQINYKVFDADAVTLANRIKASTPPKSIFLNAPTYNSAAVLSGRISVMRYQGHLGSHGIDYAEREADVKAIFRGSGDAGELLRKYGVDYVLISPEERNSLAVNDNFFRKYPVIAESGQYRVYKIGAE